MIHGTPSGLYSKMAKLRAKKAPYSGLRSLVLDVHPLMKWEYGKTFEADSKITVANEPGSSNLTIRKPYELISGSYRAMISSLYRENNSACVNGIMQGHSCSAFVLPLLRHNALTSPVDYYVVAEGKGNHLIYQRLLVFAVVVL